jgi:hypothetical protein
MNAIKIVQKYLIRFVVLGILCLSACNERVNTPTYTLIVNVRNVFNQPVQGARVTLYLTQDDFEQDRNPLVNQLTNTNGDAVFTGLSINTLGYHISAERETANNWSSETRVNFANIGSPEQDARIVIAESAIANGLAGRSERRWRRTRQIINSSVQEGCNFRQDFVFSRRGSLNIFNGAGCPGEGQLLGTNFWSQSPDGLAILLGTSSTSSQQRLVILELTATRLRYIETPLQNVTIINEFDLVP